MCHFALGGGDTKHIGIKWRHRRQVFCVIKVKLLGNVIHMTEVKPTVFYDTGRRTVDKRLEQKQVSKTRIVLADWSESRSNNE